MDATSLGIGVMIGAGIFALLGQVADIAGSLFPLVFLAGAVVTGFSAYSYIKMANAYPSAGGIGMFFVKIYGKGTITASASLIMAITMVLNQSLVARTFGAYALQVFNVQPESYLVPLLGVGLLIGAFLINITNNDIISGTTSVLSALKVIGITIFALAGLWASGFSLQSINIVPPVTSNLESGLVPAIAGTALTILAFKGFTTITNSGSEIVNPHRNVGRAIVITIIISAIVYGLVAWAVASNLSLTRIIQAQDYALAEAARPAFGSYGLWFTVGIAIIATVSAVIANIFAVSRMLAMLTNMKLIPHKHFGMPGTIQQHMLVYTVVTAIVLTLLFDLSRIASIGAILYLFMDILFHWGIWRKLRKEVKAKSYIVFTAIVLDAAVLLAFIWIKLLNDQLIVLVSVIMIVFIFIGERYFLKTHSNGKENV